MPPADDRDHLEQKIVWYRQEAERLRTVAAKMHNPIPQASLLTMAKAYADLADMLSRRLKS